MEESISKVVTMMPRTENGERMVVAVDGLSQSGKTTIGNKIKQYFLDQKSPCVFFTWMITLSKEEGGTIPVMRNGTNTINCNGIQNG